MLYFSAMMRRTRTSTSNVLLLFIRQTFHAQREKTAGIYHAARERGWQVLPAGDAFSCEKLSQLIDLWHPLGCLVDVSALEEHEKPTNGSLRSLLRKVPTILLARDRFHRRQRLDCSRQQVRAPVILATRHFRDMDLRDFAYLPDPDHPFWSTERGNIFRAATRSWGFSEYGGRSQLTAEGFADLCSWLSELPKPCGLLLASDHVAPPLYSAARHQRIEIGKDLIVLGVDNDEMICNSVTPTLSSISFDYFQSGVNAVKLLENRIKRPDRPPQTLLYSTIEVVRRQSSARGLPDRRAAKALAYIEENATRHDINITSVAKVMGCCRTLAARLFRKHVQKSILEAIRERRMKKAFSLLKETTLPIDAIPGMCGYASTAHFKVDFRRLTGMTMREWRKHHAE